MTKDMFNPSNWFGSNKSTNIEKPKFGYTPNKSTPKIDLSLKKKKTPEQELDDKIDKILIVEPLKNFKFEQVKTIGGKKYYFVDGFVDEDISEDGDEGWDMYKTTRGVIETGGDVKYFCWISNTGGERCAVYAYYKDPVKMKELIKNSTGTMKYTKNRRNHARKLLR